MVCQVGLGALPAAPTGLSRHQWTFAEDAGVRREGTVEPGVPLAPADLAADQARGGDGRVAVFAGGHLDATGPIPAISIQADFTVAVRLSLDGIHFDLSRRNDAVLIDWVGLDTAEKPARHNLSLEVLSIGHIAGNRYLGFFVDNHFINVPLGKLTRSGWHDVVLRVRQNIAELFINGELLARKDLTRQAMVGSTPAAGLIPTNYLRFGRNRRGELPLRGRLAQVTVANIALADSEVAALSGRRGLNTNWQQPKDWGRNWAGYYEEDISLGDAYQRMYLDYQAFYRRALREDPYFPRFHLVTPGFMTEPSMASYKTDAYHIFPHGHIGWRGVTYEEAHYWHHLMSRDLLQWKLMPFPEWPHPNTGNMITRDGLTLCFPQNPRMDQFEYEKWTSADADLAKWSFARSVKLPAPPSGLFPMNHFLFTHLGHWYLLGAYAGRSRQHPHTRGIMELYRAKDEALEDWEYRGHFYRGTSDIVHHPRLFFLGDKVVMDSDTLIDRDAEYVVGRIENERFVREGGGTFHFGYPSTVWGGAITEQDGRVLHWALIRGMNSEINLLSDTVRRGWQNAYSMPRVAGLKEGQVTFEPAPEMQALRREHLHTADRVELAEVRDFLPVVAGDQFEIRCRIRPDADGSAGIVLQAAEDDVVRYYYDSIRRRLVLDFKQSKYGGKGLPASLHHNVEVPYDLKPGAEIELRLFFDHSIIEVYADGLVSAGRWYPESPDRVRAGLFSENSPATFTDVDLWSMGTIWEAYAPTVPK